MRISFIGGIGQVGKILEVKSWDDYDKRGAVKVKWKSGSCTNTYRVGAHGCVDVIYTQKTKATSGGKYYPDHLPVVAHVGETNQFLSYSEKVRYREQGKLFVKSKPLRVFR